MSSVIDELTCMFPKTRAADQQTRIASVSVLGTTFDRIVAEYH